MFIPRVAMIVTLRLVFLEALLDYCDLIFKLEKKLQEFETNLNSKVITDKLFF